MDGLSKNEFGKLVRAYREQRGWTQDKLAEQWGYSREYISQVESGKRKIDRWEQVNRLADILQIPEDRLRDMGKLPPKPTVRTLAEADDAILQTLLESSVLSVKLSWLVWYANQNSTILSGLDGLVTRLETILSAHRGELVKPAQRVLAYAYEMKGKLSFDHLNYREATQYFLEMEQLGEELNDASIIALSMIYRGHMLRKRGRWEKAIQFLKGAKPFADVAHPSVRTMRWNYLAREYSWHGDENEFLEATAKAEEELDNAQDDVDSVDSLYNKFNRVEVLQERAQGYTLLWKPEKALAIYKETDILRPFRPLRDLGSYTIVKAQANAYMGDVELGVKLAIEGIEMAKQYDSQRHIERVQGMYRRLSITPQFAKHESVKTLREALAYAGMPV